MTEESLFELLSLECRVDHNGTIRYYNALGLMHRVHGPAVIHENGRHEWWQNGQLHRLDKPAVERPDGFRSWCQNGLQHRVGGPAIESPDGYRAWCQNGLQHRVGGPAIEHVDGSREWYIDGNELTEAEWQRIADVLPAFVAETTVFEPHSVG